MGRVLPWHGQGRTTGSPSVRLCSVHPFSSAAPQRQDGNALQLRPSLASQQPQRAGSRPLNKPTGLPARRFPGSTLPPAFCGLAGLTRLAVTHCWLKSEAGAPGLPPTFSALTQLVRNCRRGSAGDWHLSHACLPLLQRMPCHSTKHRPPCHLSDPRGAARRPASAWRATGSQRCRQGWPAAQGRCACWTSPATRSPPCPPDPTWSGWRCCPCPPTACRG